MATYVVTNSAVDDYETGRRFKTRAEADRVFEEEVGRGAFVRLIRWDWVAPNEGRPTLLRSHAGQGPARSVAAPDPVAP